MWKIEKNAVSQNDVRYITDEIISVYIYIVYDIRSIF